MTRLQKIVAKITERLEQIQTANGYRTDAGLRTVLIDTEADPQRTYDGQAFDSGLVLQIGSAEPEDESGNVVLGNRASASFVQSLTIFGFRRMTNREDWFGLAQELEADIKQSVFGQPEDRRYYDGTGLGSIRMATVTAQIPLYGDQYVAVEVPIELSYIENLSQPWEP